MQNVFFWRKKQKLKIALCLYGRYNNRFSTHSGDDGHKYIKKQILSHKADVFIYSQEPSMKEHILEKYRNTTKYKFENPKDFSQIIQENGINEEIFQNKEREQFRTVANSLNFFYNRKQAIVLKQEHEKANNFTYDVVIVCRFDLAQIDKYNGKQPYRVSHITFNPYLNMHYIYTAMWNQLNCGYADQWFYSSSKNIDALSTMYDKSLQYFQPNSAYLQAIANGIIDSNADDEFSNEYFKKEKCRKMYQYKVNEGINNHLMHKYFMIDANLYNCSKFL